MVTWLKEKQRQPSKRFSGFTFKQIDIYIKKGNKKNIEKILYITKN